MRFFTIKFYTVLPAVTLILAIYFRLFNLGYSDFQGDEAKALGFLFTDKNYIDFLLTNSKGPGQYLITYVIYPSIKPFDPELILRLPFALAGTLTILTLYKLMKRYFGNSEAVFATMMIGLSGLMIAFSRIVQYQSFVMLTSVLTLWMIFQYWEKGKIKYLLLAGSLSAMGLMFHYDALSYIIPFAFVIFIPKRNIKHFAYYLAPLTLTLIFFIPYTQTDVFHGTLNYWYHDRATLNFSYDPIFYGWKLLTLYNPKELLILMFIPAGLFLYTYPFDSKSTQKIYKFLFVLTLVFIGMRHLQESPRRLFQYPSYFLFLTSSAILLTNKHLRKSKREYLTITWFLFGFFVYGLFFSKPLTHIYNFMVPLGILSALYLGKIAKRHSDPAYIILIIVSVGAISFNYKAFIQTKPEYPKAAKTYIYGRMYQGISEGEIVRGVFGFPYNRKLKELKNDLTKLSTLSKVYAYNSNEKQTILRFYLPGHIWSNNVPHYYIHINNPQSLEPAPLPPHNPLIKKGNYSIYLVE